MSRRTELKRKLLLEERERRWKELDIPLHIIPDAGQDGGLCECASGKEYGDCCGSGTTEGLISIRGSRALNTMQKFHDDPNNRNPRGDAEKLIAMLGRKHFLATTLANIRRVQSQPLVQNNNGGKLPPVLYHSTYASSARRILASGGLKPRRLTGMDNYKEDGLSSHPNHIYLTEVHSMFYLARLDCNKLETVVLAIDTYLLDDSCFYPDEDYASMIQYIEDGAPKPTQRQDEIRDILAARDRIEDYKHLWFASLRGYGNVAYRGTIPVEAISPAIPTIQASPGNFVHFSLKSDYLLAGYPLYAEQARETQAEFLKLAEAVPA